MKKSLVIHILAILLISITQLPVVLGENRTEDIALEENNSLRLETISLQESVLTQHNDNARTGSYLAETQLKPSNVNQSSFGRLYSRKVSGTISATAVICKRGSDQWHSEERALCCYA